MTFGRGWKNGPFQIIRRVKLYKQLAGLNFSGPPSFENTGFLSRMIDLELKSGKGKRSRINQPHL